MRDTPGAAGSAKMPAVVVYEPHQRAKMGLVQSWATVARGIHESRELVWQLFKRDFLANYKQSLLGALWIFLAPLFAIVSWVFLNAVGVLKPGEVGVPYPVYVLVGGTLWGLFMAFYSSCATCLASAGGLILQVRFPHEALVAKQIVQTAAAFAIQLALIVAALLAFGIVPGRGLLFLPLAALPLLFMGAGIGMLVSVAAAVVHDVERAVTAALGFSMYLAPIVYAPDSVSSALQRVVRWNPLAHLVAGARDLVLRGGIEDPRSYAVSAALSLIFFLLAWRLFFLCEHKVMERL